MYAAKTAAQVLERAEHHGSRDTGKVTMMIYQLCASWMQQDCSMNLLCVEVMLANHKPVLLKQLPC
jgi:hypothetical protein